MRPTPFAYGRRASDDQKSGAQEHDPRRFEPADQRPGHGAEQGGGEAGADGRQGERHPDHDVERGEREDSLLLCEVRLQRTHPGGERVSGGGAEADRAEVRRPQTRRQAEHGDDDPDHERPERGALDRIPARRALECGDAEDGAGSEQRDEPAELGVAGVEHLAHEHDAGREQRPQAERDRSRRRHHRPDQWYPERAAEAGVLGRSVGGGGAGEIGGAGDARERHEERQRVDPEHERVRPAPDVTPRERGNRGERRRAQGDAPVRRPEDQAVGERELVAVDDVGDRRVARREEHDARHLDEERPQVDPPQAAHERDERDHRGARRVHGEHRAPTVPAARRPRRERTADRCRDEPQREDPAHRGGRPPGRAPAPRGGPPPAPASALPRPRGRQPRSRRTPSRGSCRRAASRRPATRRRAARRARGRCPARRRRGGTATSCGRRRRRRRPRPPAPGDPPPWRDQGPLPPWRRRGRPPLPAARTRRPGTGTCRRRCPCRRGGGRPRVPAGPRRTRRGWPRPQRTAPGSPPPAFPRVWPSPTPRRAKCPAARRSDGCARPTAQMTKTRPSRTCKTFRRRGPKGGNMGRRLRRAVLAGVVAIVGGSFSLTGAGAESSPEPAQVGRFLPPFEDMRSSEGQNACHTDADGRQLCKPAGATVVALANGKVLYWDALEGTENVQLSIVLEFAKQARNDRSRTIDLSGPQPVFGTPNPADAGANPGGYSGNPLPVPSLPLPSGNGDTTVNDGDLFCADQVQLASGVSKLLKPVYPGRPFDSGTNVKQLELYDPATGQWSVLPESANRSLPLFPRLHLLPNGHVYYDVAGQSFNPFGQAYDEAFWNLAASFDPTGNRWADLGVPGVTAGSPDPGVGFRGSTFSTMLPLEPDASGNYTKASFLTAGGTPSAVAPSPGTPLGSNASRIDTVNIGPTGSETLSSESTGPLQNARWYPSGVLLPSGQVMAFSGADIDAVQAPSLGRP